MISERIFDNKVTIEQIINMIFEERIDMIFHQFYPETKVNNATSLNQEQEDVA